MKSLKQHINESLINEAMSSSLVNELKKLKFEKMAASEIRKYPMMAGDAMYKKIGDTGAFISVSSEMEYDDEPEAVMLASFGDGGDAVWYGIDAVKVGLRNIISIEQILTTLAAKNGGDVFNASPSELRNVASILKKKYGATDI